jgi:hypothetical protein
MRRVLRKIKRNQELSAVETASLRTYAASLQGSAWWEAFQADYGRLLAENYQIILPHFACSIDTVCRYLSDRPKLLQALAVEPLTLKHFPAEFHSFLLHTITGTVSWEDVGHWLNQSEQPNTVCLPQPRQAEIVYKYETNNPNKELGLKAHFERLSQFSFISRLQSYRYLTKAKVPRARIEVVAPDCLGGIFTNKEKSIYYYIFLTEAEEKKAQSACRLLNAALYGYEYDDDGV